MGGARVLVHATSWIGGASAEILSVRTRLADVKRFLSYRVF